jgi:hypothetical protein
LSNHIIEPLFGLVWMGYTQTEPAIDTSDRAQLPHLSTHQRPRERDLEPAGDDSDGERHDQPADGGVHNRCTTFGGHGKSDPAASKTGPESAPRRPIQRDGRISDFQERALPDSLKKMRPEAQAVSLMILNRNLFANLGAAIDSEAILQFAQFREETVI